MKSQTKYSLSLIAKQITSLVIMLCVMIVVASCNKEIMTEDPNRIITSGPVKVSLHIEVPEMDKIETRATDDVAIVVLNVMAFNSAGELTDAPTEVVVTGSGPSIKYYATLQATTQARTVYVIANASAAITNFGTTHGWKVLGVSGITSATATKLTDVKANLKMPDLATTTNITVQPSLLPMVGEKSLPSGVNSATIISNDGTTTNPLPLVRTMAKIAIVFTPEAFPGGSLSATLCKAPNNGNVLSSTELPTTGVTLKNYSNNATSLGMIVSSAPGALQSPSLYCYESAKENETNVVISTSRGFFRLNLIDKLTQKHIDIKRNTHYTITVTKIDNDGYGTAREASLNPPSNIEYEIDVTDLNSHDIVTNGQYFLGLSNSEVIIYDNTAQSNQVVVNITHNAPAAVTTADIKLISPGADISLSPSSLGVTVSGDIATFKAPTGNRQTAVLKINMVASNKPETNSEIIIRLGNLKKVIKVTRIPSLSPFGAVLQDFNSAINVKADIASSEAVSWLSISANESGGNSSNSTVINPAGGIYPILENNTPISGGSSRRGAFYVSRKDDSGRTRVIVSQEYVNLGVLSSDPLKYPYVGAFWRANQTGERLIKMPFNSENLGAWTATVLDGAHWVVLDDQPTTDPGVDWENPSATPADMNTSDANYQVAGKAKYIRGFGLSTGDDIYFRLGLRSRYSPTPLAPVRYARVGVSYNNNTKYQILYLRQGEKADYVMRPNDVDGNGINIIDNRVFARKFTPYNLTAAALDQQATIGTDQTNPGKFTEYPSHAGALWQSVSAVNERVAYNPYGDINVRWQSGAHTLFYWDNILNLNDIHPYRYFMETCPPGYRRPTDGSTSVGIQKGYVLSSEMRQSLFLNPKDGADYDMANSSFGYYADGYFDRRSIQSASGSFSSVKSAVSSGTPNVAYTGRVYFNPITNASLFFPATGFRTSSYGVLSYAGVYGNYWSSSSLTTNNDYRFSFNDLQTYQGAASRGYGFSIRCISENTLRIKSHTNMYPHLIPEMDAEKDMFTTNGSINFGPNGVYKALDGVVYYSYAGANIIFEVIQYFEGVLIVPFLSMFNIPNFHLDLIAERIKSGKLALIIQSDGTNTSNVHRSDVRIMANLLGKSAEEFETIFNNDLGSAFPRMPSIAYTAKPDTHPYLTGGPFTIPSGFTSIPVNISGSAEFPINMAPGVTEAQYSDFVVLGRKTATSVGDIMIAAHRKYPFLIIRNGSAFEKYDTATSIEQQGLNSLWMNFVVWANEYKKSVAPSGN